MITYCVFLTHLAGKQKERNFILRKWKKSPGTGIRIGEAGERETQEAGWDGMNTCEGVEMLRIGRELFLHAILKLGSRMGMDGSGR